MTTIASQLRVVAHTVRAVHATTKTPLPVTAVFANDAPHHWRIKVAHGLVVVSRAEPGRAPLVPVVLTLTVTDPLLPLAATTADVTLDAADKTQELAPAPATVEVILVKRNGTPATGATVSVKPSTGTAVPLAAQPGGVYTATRTWGAAFHPLDVRVGNESARRVAYDPTSLVQRIRLVDPT